VSKTCTIYRDTILISISYIYITIILSRISMVLRSTRETWVRV